VKTISNDISMKCGLQKCAKKIFNIRFRGKRT